MAFQKNYGDAKPVSEPACIYLRSKSMYVTGQVRTADHADEEAGQHCWCNLTQHVRGPDKQTVDRARCTPGRDCYRESY